MAKTKSSTAPTGEEQVDNAEQQPVEQSESGAPAQRTDEHDAEGAAEQPAPPVLTGELVKARALVDGSHGKCNDVIEIDSSLLAALSGVVDADPAAVAYAESLAK
jgi:ornithine cyclodeaminase/alanine dehydrogenase-like protein (mu-crystallin family)